MNLKGTLAKQILEAFPDAPTLTLARILHRDEPLIFSSVEDARFIIRYHRGACGDKNRECLADTDHIKPAGPTNPFPPLPEGLKHFDEWKPIILDEKRILVLADLHMPYHDKAVTETALDYGQVRGVDSILLLGDTHDMFSCSFWEQDPRKRDFQRELSMGRDFYAYLRGRFPNAVIRAKFGNHEERYARVMAVKAPQFYGVDSFQFETIMHLDRYDVELIPERKILKVGKLHLVHGHEFGKSVFSPVNPARGLYLRGKENALCAHWHVTSEHTETSMGGKVIGCWSLGCLCDLHPDYAPINKWNHGAAIVENLGADGGFKVDNFRIIDGKVY